MVKQSNSHVGQLPRLKMHVTGRIKLHKALNEGLVTAKPNQSQARLKFLFTSLFRASSRNSRKFVTYNATPSWPHTLRPGNFFGKITKKCRQNAHEAAERYPKNCKVPRIKSDLLRKLVCWRSDINTKKRKDFFRFLRLNLSQFLYYILHNTLFFVSHQGMD